MFNKYFKPTEVSTKILVRFRVNYHITHPEGEALSNDPYINWRNFTERDGGVSSRLIADVLRAHIPLLNQVESFYWNSRYFADQQGGYIEVEVQSMTIPEPTITKCRVVGCPYSNYFGVCRNCEDNPLAIPDQAAIEEHQNLYADFIEQIEDAEELPFLTLNQPQIIKGYIYGVGEIEAHVTPV